MKLEVEESTKKGSAVNKGSDKRKREYKKITSPKGGYLKTRQ
jgi:hypothetical protein